MNFLPLPREVVHVSFLLVCLDVGQEGKTEEWRLKTVNGIISRMESDSSSYSNNISPGCTTLHWKSNASRTLNTVLSFPIASYADNEKSDDNFFVDENFVFSSWKLTKSIQFLRILKHSGKLPKYRPFFYIFCWTLTIWHLYSLQRKNKSLSISLIILSNFIPLFPLEILLDQIPCPLGLSAISLNSLLIFYIFVFLKNNQMN